LGKRGQNKMLHPPKKTLDFLRLCITITFGIPISSVFHNFAWNFSKFKRCGPIIKQTWAELEKSRNWVMQYFHLLLSFLLGTQICV